MPSVDEHYSGLRRKDRVTYKHNMFQIDLTQVKTFEVGFVPSFYLSVGEHAVDIPIRTML